MSATHTPGPWRILAQSPYRGGAEICAGDSTVAVMYREVGYDDWQDVEPLPQAEANAAFIVRACNAHEELVKALKASLLAIPDGMLSTNQAHIVQQIRHAIAKAEGKE